MAEITERIAMDMARSLIKKHEGLRCTLYEDTQGHLTGGYGHNFSSNGYLPAYIWDIIYDNMDFPQARRDAEELMNEYDIPFPGLPRKIVLIDMAFNLGKDKLRGFKKMWAALKNRDYETAGKEMLDSLWAKQVGCRAVELEKSMREGSYISG